MLNDVTCQSLGRLIILVSKPGYLISVSRRGCAHASLQSESALHAYVFDCMGRISSKFNPSILRLCLTFMQGSALSPQPYDRKRFSPSVILSILYSFCQSIASKDDRAYVNSTYEYWVLQHAFVECRHCFKNMRMHALEGVYAFTC